MDGDLRSRVQGLVKGTLEHLSEIDGSIEKCSKNWDLPRMPAMDRAILRLGAFELLKTDTPVRVVINECVELAKTYGTEHSSKFINGILDSIAKSKG
jgi:N utilization substance protein B